MKFEDTIRRISSFVAIIVVYLIVAGFYLQTKGFEYDGAGSFVLKQAYAAEDDAAETKEIASNFGFPQDHILGNKNAPITLYEYSSFGCTHCADFHLEVLPKLKEKYIDTGKVKLGFVPFPLEKNSMNAALLAECVSAKEYFPFVNVLFKKQRDWMMAFDPEKVLLQYAALSGLNKDKAKVCLKNDITAARILKDREDGLKELHIKGTPSFVLSSKKGNELVPGFHDFDYFANLIDGLLEHKVK